MSLLWYVNQAGIVLEVIGALIIVVSAFQARKEIKGIKDTWDAGLPEKLRDLLASQAFTELKGFGLLAIGLIMQFAGGFSQ